MKIYVHLVYELDNYLTNPSSNNYKKFLGAVKLTKLIM